MLELEVYAAGLGELDKILELDHQLSAVPGLRYKVDRNHNLVYLELDQPTITFREIRVSSAQFRPSFGQKQKRSRWVYKHNPKCSLDSLTRWEDHSSGSFSIWARWFSWRRIRSARFLRIDYAGNYFSTKLSRSDCFHN